MKNIHKITLEKFIKLSAQDKEIVNFVLEDALKENYILRIGKRQIYPCDLWRVSYADMIFLKDNINDNGFIDCINIVYGTTLYQIYKANIYNVFAVLKYITKKLQEIIDLEKQEFESQQDKDEEKAGINMFDRYGYYNELRSLTGGDRTKDKFYLDMPYIDIFMELTYKSKLIKFEKKLSEIKNK